LVVACARPPVEDQITIEPVKTDDSVIVTVQTSFELHPRNDETRRRVEIARAAALSSTDAWSIRFGNLQPAEESLTFEKTAGTLERVTRSVRIPSDDLHRVFADANITVDVLRGEGWRELTFYPGTSGRASREQQRQFETELAAWSRSVARYFIAMDHLYSYLRDQPERAPYFFAALLNEKNVDGSDPMVAEDELPIIEAVLASMTEIAERMDNQEERAATFAEEADLIFNPFPGRVTIRVPAGVISAEGFSSQKGNDLVIEPVDLFAAIAALEGKWISPDPLAALLRDQTPRSSEIASLPRKSTAVVNSTDIARAIREQLARPKTYSVRWREGI
jgi:hypothetical protein